MVTSEVLCRVVKIICGKEAGTAFTIEKNESQYLITAKHIFKESGYLNEYDIGVLINNVVKTIRMNVYYHTNDEIDIAILKPVVKEYFTLTYENTYTIEGLVLGQDVYFLGFPFGMFTNAPLIKATSSVPFVKKSIVSGGTNGQVKLFFLDGQNNPGFSGGPFCAKIPGQKHMSICGVISSYRFNKSYVFDSNNVQTNYYIKENTGIIIATSISHALEILESI